MLVWVMGLNATARRRWFGALVLLAALGMLIAGETVLEGRFEGLGWLVYWLLCLGLTGLAVLVALADVRALRRQIHREERDLLQTTLNEIESEARHRMRPPERDGEPG